MPNILRQMYWIQNSDLSSVHSPRGLPCFIKVWKFMSLIVRALQVIDFQNFPVQWQAKKPCHWCHFPIEWHQWHGKNKHITRESADIEPFMTPVQWVQCVFKPFFIFNFFDGIGMRAEVSDKMRRRFFISRRRFQNSPSRIVLPNSFSAWFFFKFLEKLYNF